jgi:ABC-2 type transport system permease protein
MTAGVKRRRPKRWTPGRLLLSRIARFWREQFRIWRTAFDWTVLLYLVVPGLWMLGGLWLEMLREPPAWLTALPPELAVALFALLLFAGRLRTFLEDADALVLLQRRNWIRTLKIGGAVYTLAVTAVSTALAFAALLPWLRLHDAFDAGGLVLWAVLTAACRSLAAAARRLVASLLGGWKRWAAHIALSLALIAYYAWAIFAADGSAGWLGACAAPAFAGWAAAVGFLARMRGGYETDLRAELRARTASAGLLVSAAGIEHKPAPEWKRPIVFPRSGRILRASDPGAVLAEMRIKAFLRQFRRLGQGFQIIAVSAVALISVPGWVSPVLAAVLMALVASWLQRDWREWMDEPFVSQFRWEEAAVRRGATLSRFWIMLPAAVWFAGVAGWRFAGWLGALAGVPAGVGLWALINAAMHDLPAMKRRPVDEGSVERDASE